jgi:Secretion system C-terminal sorting domain
VITPDGTGYAVSNDAKSFIRFTTGKNLEITKLGSLVDDPSNGSVSIYDKCSSWGGDMIADEDGGLYMLTARNSVYKINIETKTAKLLGYIKGLPAGFTTNGAVVTPDGKILVSSALNDSAYFLVDHNNWTAVKYKSAAAIFKSSDLANSNYLQTKPENNITKIPAQEIVVKTVPDEQSKITIYPNPVSNNQFILQFGKIAAGNYNVTLTNVMGQTIMQHSVNVQADDQVETIYLKPSMARGVYLIKVAGQNKKNMISEKLVVQ